MKPTSPLRLQEKIMVRATDAKEVGVANPAEETFCHPNRRKLGKPCRFVNTRERSFRWTGAS